MEERASQGPADQATPPQASVAKATTPPQTLAHVYAVAGALPPFSEIADPATAAPRWQKTVQLLAGDKGEGWGSTTVAIATLWRC